MVCGRRRRAESVIRAKEVHRRRYIEAIPF